MYTKEEVRACIFSTLKKKSIILFIINQKENNIFVKEHLVSLHCLRDYLSVQSFLDLCTWSHRFNWFLKSNCLQISWHLQAYWDWCVRNLRRSNAARRESTLSLNIPLKSLQFNLINVSLQFGNGLSERSLCFKT